MTDSERRSVPRERIHFVAELELAGDRAACGVSRDASGAGLLLMTSVNPSAGTDLRLHLWVPGEENARKLAATVVRCEAIPLSEGVVWAYRVAVKFAEPPADLQHIVETLTKRNTNSPPALGH